MGKRPYRSLPPHIRDLGIGTQQELVMALLPYLEWVKRSDLLIKFEEILPYTRVRDKKYNWTNYSLKSAMHHLTKKGVVERKSGEYPSCKIQGWKPQPYSYYRRVVKEMPKSISQSSKIEGTYGLKAARARAVMRRDPPKKSVTTLSMDDLRYIQCNDLGMTIKATAEMFDIYAKSVVEIRKGLIPRHLKP